MSLEGLMRPPALSRTLCESPALKVIFALNKQFSLMVTFLPSMTAIWVLPDMIVPHPISITPPLSSICKLAFVNLQPLPIRTTLLFPAMFILQPFSLVSPLSIKILLFLPRTRITVLSLKTTFATNKLPPDGSYSF